MPSYLHHPPQTQLRLKRRRERGGFEGTRVSSNQGTWGATPRTQTMVILVIITNHERLDSNSILFVMFVMEMDLVFQIH